MQATEQSVLTPYQRIGGDTVIRKLVDRFYELMDELPGTYAARKLHPADLTESGNKLFDYLSGWLGGPQRYVEKHGHPCCAAAIFPTPSARTSTTNGCCACSWRWRTR